MDAGPITPPRQAIAERGRLRGRPLSPWFSLSALIHLLLLALLIPIVARRITPPWVPPAPDTVQLVFEGGKQPEVAGPVPQPKEAPLPEPSPAPSAAPAPPAPAAAPPAPAPAPAPPVPPVAAPSPPEQPAPAAPPSPPRMESNILALPFPEPPRPNTVAPPQIAALPPRPVFPPPMNFSLGRPSRPGPVAPSAQRLGRGIDLSLGHGVIGSERTAIFGRSDSKTVGPDWYNEFESWWERHGYYPPQAGRNGEEGDVALDLVVRRDGQVDSVRIAGRSGSQWLDMAALAVFRQARLPMLPAGSAETVPIHLTIHYVIVHR